MDKTQLLSLIQEKINEGVITPEEIQKSIHLEDTKKTTFAVKNITNIFYVIGALIVVIGAVILTAQHWDDIGFVGRVLVTLGIAITTYVSALFMKGSEHRILSQVFFTMSAVLAPVGILVFVREFDMDFGSLEQTIVAFALGLIFITAFIQTKRNILVLLTLGFVSWGYYAMLALLFPISSEIAKCATMILGVMYLLIAYYYDMEKSTIDASERNEKRSVKNIMYGIGTIGVLAPAIFLDGVFDLLSIPLIFAAFYVSTYVKSKAMLLSAGLFLIIYLIKMTSEYFVDSISWPLALIAIGFLVIGVGYGTLYLNRKYISENVTK